MARIRTFAEFWPYYLAEHSKPATRVLHLMGSTCGLVFVTLAVVRRAPVLVAIALFSGYAFAWIGHAAIEHNRPATFRYPIWSFVADWKMWGCAVSGRLARELERAGLHH